MHHSGIEVRYDTSHQPLQGLFVQAVFPQHPLGGQLGAQQDLEEEGGVGLGLSGQGVVPSHHQYVIAANTGYRLVHNLNAVKPCGGEEGVLVLLTE